MKASETLRAPAKLNLTLEVLGRRSDGLHGIRSVMVPIDLFDELYVEPADSLEFLCSDPDLASGNLAERALRLLDPLPRVRVTLHKRIPTGAGMGGGSSDAAAVLLAGARGVFGETAPADFLATARALGSDVPFFLVETAALVEGTGERVTALGAAPPWHALVIKPPVSVATAWAYEHIDRSPAPSRPRNESVSLQMCDALQRADFAAAAQLMQNDFHAAIAQAIPEITHAIEALRAAGAQHPMLTGSGSAVFALFESQAERDRCLRAVPSGDAAYRIFACAFSSGASWRSAA